MAASENHVPDQTTSTTVLKNSDCEQRQIVNNNDTFQAELMSSNFKEVPRADISTPIPALDQLLVKHPIVLSTIEDHLKVVDFTKIFLLLVKLSLYPAERHFVHCSSDIHKSTSGHTRQCQARTNFS